MDQDKNGAFEYPDEAGYPDGTGTLTEDQRELVSEVEGSDNPRSGMNFFVVKNEEGQIYDAVSGDTLVGGITYERRDDVVTLIATSVYPEFRHQGVATELIRQVLDDIRSDGLKVKIECPIVATFVRQHHEYEDMVDHS
jgi:predicted GNAT family acetyltransferase